MEKLPDIEPEIQDSECLVDKNRSCIGHWDKLPASMAIDICKVCQLKQIVDELKALRASLPPSF